MKPDAPAPSAELSDQIAALVQSLHDTERRLQELTQGQLDAVVLPTGQSYLLAAAQETLLHDEALLRNAGKMAHIGGWTVDLPEMRVSWSDEVCAIHEVVPGAVQTVEAAVNFYAPESREMVRRVVAACARDGAPYDFEAELITATGQRRWVRSIGEAVRDASGAIIRIQGAFQDISGQKLAEEALRASEERHRLLFQHNPLPMYVYDVETLRFLAVNGLAVETYGYTEAEFLTMTIRDIRPPDELPRLEQSLAARRHGEQSHRLWRHWKKNGRLMDVEISSDQIIFDGRPARLAMVNDVTERQRVEEQLKRSQALLRVGSRISRLGAWQVDMPDRVLTWSDEARAIHEVPADYVPTVEEGVDFYAPECRKTILRAFNACVAAGEPFDLELQIITFRQRRVWVRAIGEAVRDDEGKIIRVQGALQDVSERKRMELALRESEFRHRSLFENMLEGYAYCQLQYVQGQAVDYVYLEANGAFTTHTGLKDVIGKRASEVVPGMHVTNPEKLAAYARVAATGLPEQFESFIKPLDRWFSVTVYSHKKDHFICIFENITSRKKAERELVRTNRALKLLSAGNERLVRVENEQALVEEICQVAVVVGGYRMAWVGYAESDEYRTIRPVAHAGEEGGFLSEIKVSWSEDQATGRGPAGKAVRSGQPVVVEDITRNPMPMPWRDPALQHGFQSAVCLPLREGNCTFGLLVLYTGEVNRLDANEIKLLQELADDLAFGICHLRSENEKRLLRTAVLKVATGVSGGTGAEFFQELAQNMADALEATAALVVQLAPGEPSAARTMAAVVAGRLVENFSYELAGTLCEELLTADEVIVSDQAAECFPAATLLATLKMRAYVGRRLTNSAGQPVGQLVVLFDKPLKQTSLITSTLQIFAARAAAELERQRSDAQLREQAALLDAAADAIILKDMDDRILYWNRGAEQIYGWTAAEALGKKSAELLFMDQARFDFALRQLLAHNQWRGEMHKQTRDRRLLTVEVRWTLVRDQHGEPKSILATNTDITERKKLEAQFLRIQRMEGIGTLAGGVAHDLNNVLAPILMAVEVLKMMVPDEKGLAMLETLQTSAQRGADLVKQVLSFARGVEGRRVLIKPVHLVHDLLQIMRDTFPKSIQVGFHAARDLWTVTGDPTQLHQVLLNLCVNARDAMPGGGRLTIGMENVVLDETYAAMNPDFQAGAYVMVKVEDTGSGIPPEIRDKIFEPFFTTKEMGKGTGLGLSTTLAIVKSHGGFINLYSEPGKWTKFQVYLPANTSEQAAEKVAVEQTRLPQGAGELVLVVDDEDAIRKIVKNTLERFGYRVLAAANGAEAISLYARNPQEVAVVLTDMAMPVMDGPATMIALKAINPRVRIIGSSGHDSGGGVAKAIGTGVRHFVSKPYTAEIILKKIAEVLSE
jgi:PAS domain S-box-containing protein